jgi:hypothetical protein
VRLKIFFHDNCFDGATSAALFADFYRARHPGAEIALQGVQHRRGDPFAGLALDGDDNACVDFRYTADPRLSWWFDHHVSAFQPHELRAHFEADDSGQKFYDPTASSCALFLNKVLASEFDFLPSDPSGSWAELVRWADIIDSARFDSARTAVELAQPALRIMTWLEHNREPSLTHRLIGELGHRPLDTIVDETWIAGPLLPLLEEHRRHIDIVQKRAHRDGDVVFFDLTEDAVLAHNKFIAYMLFPDTVYTVSLTRGPDRAKVSVGSNPWGPRPRTHNIAAICERFGGGGHPVVGAISLPAQQLERAREVAHLVVAELRVPAEPASGSGGVV